MHDLLQRPFDTRSVATTGLFLLAIFYTAYVVRSLLLPFVLALLLSYLLRPIVRFLAKAKIPPIIGAAVLLLALGATIVYGFSLLAAPAAGWLEKAPYSLHQLEQKLLPIKKPIEKVARASGAIENLATTKDAQAKTQTVEVKEHSLADKLVVQTPELAISALTMLILLYFLLAYDGVFLAKLIKLMPTLSDKKRAVSIAHEIEGQVSRYLFTITLINCCLGVAVGTAVGFLGMPNPFMWGVMVAILNFIPYLGALTGIVLMTLAAMLSFPSASYALLFPAAYFILASLEGNFITPMVMGRSLTLNPVLVLLSLTFWGWMWGIVGIILAVPILAAFKIFCSHIEPMEPLAEFIS
jgi:predicted PurR-regulated permease PerM